MRRTDYSPSKVTAKKKILIRHFCEKFDDLNTLLIRNVDEIALSRSVEEIAKFLYFAFFTKNSKIQNGGSKKFFGQMGIVDDLVTLWVENFNKIALSCSVKEIGNFFCFAFFSKNLKIQNGGPNKFSGKCE